MAILDIDHVMCLAGSVEDTKAAYEAMGFRVAPFSYIEAMAGGNQCILFEPATEGVANYLELVSVEQPSCLSPTMKPVLGHAPGGKMVVFGVDDIEKETEERRAESNVANGPIYFSRDWDLGDEAPVTVEFGVYIPKADGVNFSHNAVAHLSLEQYVRKAWTTHPNGAKHIHSVLIVAKNPKTITERFGFLHCVPKRNGSYDLIAEAVKMEILPEDIAKAYFDFKLPDNANAAIAGVRIAADLERLRSHLSKSSVPYSNHDAEIIIKPEAAFGLMLCFDAIET